MADQTDGRGNVTTTDFHPATTEELAALLSENAQGEKRPIVPAGGGTWLDFGRLMPEAVVLKTTGLGEVRDYPARDMTITVGAGLTVGKLSEILAEERQQIPVDFPQADLATIGGVISANVSGPRRFGRGTLRDYLIGVQAVDARGRVFRAGGRVVKNVAGYDLCKLMVGSWGTLAVITEVTLKVVPIPETEAWVISTWDSPQKLDDALESLATSAARPIAMEVLNGAAADGIVQSTGIDLSRKPLTLAIMTAGSSTDVEWQTEKLSAELHQHQPVESLIVKNQAKELQGTLTGFRIKNCPFSFQANLRPSRTIEFVDAATNAGFLIQAHAANGVVIGLAPDDIDTPEQAQAKIAPLRMLAESVGVSLVIQNSPSEWKSQLDVFGSPEVAWDLMKSIKQSLDPLTLLSPNRLFAGD